MIGFRIKNVTGFEEEYMVTNCGNVFSKKRSKFLKPRNTGKGRLQIVMTKNKTITTAYVSVLVAEEFIRIRDSKEQVDHINGNPSDNRVENLRILSQSKNMRSYHPSSGSSKYRGVQWVPTRSRWMVRASKEIGVQKTVGYFRCEKEAARAFNKRALEWGYNKEAMNNV